MILNDFALPKSYNTKNNTRIPETITMAVYIYVYMIYIYIYIYIYNILLMFKIFKYNVS